MYVRIIQSAYIPGTEHRTHCRAKVKTLLPDVGVGVLLFCFRCLLLLCRMIACMTVGGRLRAQTKKERVIRDTREPSIPRGR